MQAANIALQLYTVRQRTAQDMLGTLRELAGIGYRAVEFAGYGGVPVADIRATLDELGMRAIAAHVAYDRFATDFATVVAELETLGCEHAIVPWLKPEERGAERFAAHAEAFNRWGRQCRDEGLRFGYHNHEFEFAPAPDGAGTIFAALAAATDPELVSLEIDVYWAAYAGVDPVALLGQYAGRVPLLHVKDMVAGPDRTDTPVGEGVLPWATILPAAVAAGTEWFIVEQDHPRDPLADVERSLRNLGRIVAATV